MSEPREEEPPGALDENLGLHPSASQSEMLDEKRYQRALGLLMGTWFGRFIVWRMIEEAGVFQQTFSESHARMSFSEGQRAVGLKLLGDITSRWPARYEKARRESVAWQNRISRMQEQEKVPPE